jgi:hypothetical protein
MDMQPADRYLEGTWTPPGDGSVRARMTPMVAAAMRRTPLLGLQMIGWDCVMVPMANAMLLGVAIAVRGVDLTGPQKELMQFRPFSTWKPSQDEVDEMVDAIITSLREARAAQARAVSGQ